MMYRAVLVVAAITVLNSTQAQACGGCGSEDGAMSSGGEVSFDISNSGQVCEQGGPADELFSASTVKSSCDSVGLFVGARASFEALKTEGTCVCDQSNAEYVDWMISSFEDEEVCLFLMPGQKTTGG